MEKDNKFTYDEIKEYILKSKKNINEKVVDLFSKYFSALFELNVLPNNINIEQLINKALNNIKDYVFYDNNDKELLKKLEIGKKNKGLAQNSILYVNKNQTDEMVEITFYHELTHLLQNHSDTINSHDIGVMKNWKYRLLMEGQTQYLAELIYSKVHGKKRQEIYQNTEELRMIPGGKVKSNLRNYELYDCILSKMCLFLNIDKKDFVKLNFMGKNAPELLTKKIVDLYGEDVCNFVWESLDLIYSTDVIIYGSDDGELLPDKCNVSSIVDGREINASSKNQMKTINNLDKVLYYGIVNKFPGNLDKFIPYIISDENLFMPKSEEYAEASAASMEEVETNPKKFIMSECIPACQELWKKNIYTFMTSDYQDHGRIWIEINEEISPENLDILKSLKLMGIKTYIYHDNCYTFAVDGYGKEASDKLLKAAKMFKMQDVPKNIAYQTEEDFLISCGCYKNELNPEYIEMNEFFEMSFSSIEEQRKYMDEYAAWKNSSRSQKYIIKYDPSKKEKTTADYAEEHNKIFDSGRIYKSEYDYKKHLAYEDYIKAKIEYLSHYENGVETVNDNNIIESRN